MSDYFVETFTDLPLFRPSDPPTSKEAGRRARRFAAGHEAKILEALELGPATKDGIAARCGLTEQQVARRMRPLVVAGLVEVAGQGRSASGSLERLYRKS